jgi:hypothetical protein
MSDHLEILRQHLAYRRGEDEEMTSPYKLVKALDATIAEVERLRLIATCGCGDTFTLHDPGTCANCMAAAEAGRAK